VQPHYDHEALGALSHPGGRGVGIARYIRNADDPLAADVAVSVVDDWQRRGLATELRHRTTWSHCPSAAYTPDALERALRMTSGPTIVSVECGNVNTGAFDDFTAVADLADAHRAAGNPTWVAVDGAVMLLAAASPAMGVLVTVLSPAPIGGD
jgi:hypothetical protein